ncbi:MAG: CPBP family intramembrane glutamic endopeptidase [Thermodesulfobacteriota bacterium]
MSPRRKAALWLEFLLIFAGAPLLILAVRERWFTVGVLWAGAAGMYLYSRRLNEYRTPEDTAFREKIKYILIRFAVLAPIITAVVWITVPESFLSFPRQRPWIWGLVMVLYPLLSVWPQEMIYRAFLLRRYAPLFGVRSGYILTSALAFGYMHIIFINSVAVVMSILGGLLFAWNYKRNRSLGLVSVEHALYGCLIFTIGLGRFFFVGTTWH